MGNESAPGSEQLFANLLAHDLRKAQTALIHHELLTQNRIRPENAAGSKE
jgi:hypothetical protein